MSEASPRRYQIKPLSASVNRSLRKIHPVNQQRIRIAIEHLADNPKPVGAIQLRPGLHRIRVGSYRIIYSLDDPQRFIEIARVESRGENTYRNLTGLT